MQRPLQLNIQAPGRAKGNKAMILRLNSADCGEVGLAVPASSIPASNPACVDSATSMSRCNQAGGRRDPRGREPVSLTGEPCDLEERRGESLATA
jgi:hypothetical protein